MTYLHQCVILSDSEESKIRHVVILSVSEESSTKNLTFYKLYIHMDKKWYVYILASQKNWTLYIWVTSNLEKRIFEHKSELIDWFTKRYHIHNLVRYQEFPTIMEAIEREKHLKWISRKKKLALIEENNPLWNDLSRLV